MNFITFFDKISRLLFWPRSSAAEQLPLKQLAGGSNPPGVTILEMARELGATLAAPPSADSAAKGYFKSGRSCRKKEQKKKRKN